MFYDRSIYALERYRTVLKGTGRFKSKQDDFGKNEDGKVIEQKSYLHCINFNHTVEIVFDVLFSYILI